jgi:ribosomal protein S18 acetylase RimI-like enzyme
LKRISIPLSIETLLALPLVMLRDNRKPIPQYKPEKGFYIKKFKRGQEKDWADLEYSVGEFKSKKEALGLFFKEFGTNIELLCQRCFFLYNKDREIIGTVMGWEDSDFFSTLTGRMHWLCIRPDYQNRGLAKPLITAALNEISKHREIVYLTTLPVNFPAIRLYLDFGFFPFVANHNYQKLFDLTSQLHFHPYVTEITRNAISNTKRIFGREYQMSDILKLIL